MKRLIVKWLEDLCDLLDRIPLRENGRRVASCWGCRLGLADLSARLDERWETGHWKAVE